MKKVIAIIMTVFMMIGLAACGATDNTEQQKEITDIAVYDDTQADILTAEFYDLENGTPVVRVHFKFTNNQADGLYMYECFAVRAFQNDTQPLLSLETVFEIEHIYAKNRHEKEGTLTNPKNVESLGNKALLEKRRAGLKLQEIADEFNCSLSKVKSHLKYAKEVASQVFEVAYA